MVGFISAVRLCHDRENGFWDADAHCYGCRVSLCACNKAYPLAALHWCLGMPFLVLTASFDPAAFFSSSWKKEEETWGTYSVTLPARRPFCAALGKASFPCRVGQGPPFTHLGVLGSCGHPLLQPMNTQKSCPWIDLPTGGCLVNARVSKHVDYKKDTDMAILMMGKARLLQTSFILVSLCQPLTSLKSTKSQDRVDTCQEICSMTMG